MKDALSGDRQFRGRQIARAALLAMAAFILSRLLGLAREVILAYVFGASP